MCKGASLMRKVTISVSGNVQGVGFRHLTEKYAQKIGVVGYVKNMDNSGVLIIAQGYKTQIDDLIDWLKQSGPVSSNIDNLEVEQTFELELFTAFNIVY